MTSELSVELLAQLTSQVLEEAAFVFSELAEQPRPFGPKVVQAQMSFATEVRGELWLAADPAFTVTLAANLLGEEPDSAEVRNRGRDALGELLNMLAGTLLARLATPGQPAQLGLPVVTERAAAEHEQLRARAGWSVSLVTEDGARVDALALRMPPG